MDEKVQAFNAPHFIATDPIQIPHQFDSPEDIEIAGFLTALIAWGNRKAIIQSAEKMMDFLHHSPYDFVIEPQPGGTCRIKSVYLPNFSR